MGGRLKIKVDGSVNSARVGLSKANREQRTCRVLNSANTTTKAISFGRISKRCGGPVDLARSTDEPWADRYITTAAPSEHHASGYRLERLDG